MTRDPRQEPRSSRTCLLDQIGQCVNLCARVLAMQTRSFACDGACGAVYDDDPTAEINLSVFLITQNQGVRKVTHTGPNVAVNLPDGTSAGMAQLVYRAVEEVKVFADIVALAIGSGPAFSECDQCSKLLYRTFGVA